jgi:hypothetical protein
MGKPDPNERKRLRMKLAKTEGKCSRCSPHAGENRGRRPRPDKHKDHRKGNLEKT